MANDNDVVFSGHAMARCFERGLTPEEVIQVIRTGETIRDYPDDKPYPSRLILGYCQRQPLHVVTAHADDRTVVVTAYVPDSNVWDETFTRRRT